jgi:hypothetical protein
MPTTFPSQPGPPSLTSAWTRRDFRRELWEQTGHRVTVIWSCNSVLACATGRIIEVGCDFVKVRGAVPTFAEHIARGDCDDAVGAELETAIPLEHVCAVVEKVPDCRKAGLSFCCDPRLSHADR